ncbi:MAG: hypothetical protein GKB99_04185 [Methanocellales archaeon]|nr:hypothetical protein [Methanocellales archaeon]
MTDHRCPGCGSENVAKIIYGWIPNLTDDLEEDFHAGKIHLGGCCVRPDKWHCNECEHEWGKHSRKGFN